MGIRQPTNLRERVRQAAERVLARNRSVGPLELLMEMDLLNGSHFDRWQRGFPDAQPLERWIQGSPAKQAETFRLFSEWVHERQLQPVPASYQRASSRGAESLRITARDDEEFENFCRTHYAAGDLSTKQTERIAKKLNKAPELVVFVLTSDEAKCHDCGTTLFKGNLIFLEKQQSLCLACADLDHLEFLPAGDAALTRRAKKYSPLSAVVVQFNRRRKRYERQGLLATPEAIAQAEQECADDAEERAVRRLKDAERRRAEDQDFVAELTAAIRAQFPGVSADEAGQIAAHTAVRGSGRVGRSAAGRALVEEAVELAVVAWVRHQHTDYDSLLMTGVERQDARDQIRDAVQKKLREWRR